MVLLFAALALLACSDAKPSTVSANTTAAPVVYDNAAAIQYVSCPIGYFSTEGPWPIMIFVRRVHVTRRNSPLENPDQVQCSSAPDSALCAFKEGKSECLRSDKIDRLDNVELYCEYDPDHKNCYLGGSCVIRCKGPRTEVIVGIVIAVLAAVALVVIFVVGYYRRVL